MSKHPSTDYHDYVIKDGRLIARFDDMYVFAEDVPWHQDEQERWTDVRVTMDLLGEVAPFEHIGDIGCGLGFFLDTLCRSVGASDVVGSGFDVAEHACRRAHRLFPSYEFRSADVAADCPALAGWSSAIPEGSRQLVACRGLLWYVFPRLERVVDNIASAVRPQQYLLVSQNFPPLDSDFVGKDVIPGPETLASLFGRHLAVQKSVWLQDHLSGSNDNWWIALFRKPA